MKKSVKTLFPFLIGAALTISRLASLHDCLLHRFVGLPREREWVFLANDVLESFTVHENVIDKPDAFSQGDEIQIVREVVQVDVGLVQRVGRANLDLTVPR